jgi:ATP-binding cassette subfamily F protein 3
MAKLEAEKTALESRLADPAVYNGSTRDLMDLQLRHAEIKEKIAAVETEWLEAQEALEGAA